MTNINSVLARVFVSSLDAAIPLYQELADVADVTTSLSTTCSSVRSARSCCLPGTLPPTRDRVATILLDRLGSIITAIENEGGQIVEGPSTAPNGARLIARHPDGSVFEYIENGRCPTADQRT